MWYLGPKGITSHDMLFYKVDTITLHSIPLANFMIPDELSSIVQTIHNGNVDEELEIVMQSDENKLLSSYGVILRSTILQFTEDNPKLTRVLQSFFKFCATDRTLLNGDIWCMERN